MFLHNQRSYGVINWIKTGFQFLRWGPWRLTSHLHNAEMWISYSSFLLFHTLTFGDNCSTSLIRRRFMDRWCINTLFCRHTQRTSGPQSVLFLKIYTATAANHWWEPSAARAVMCAHNVRVGLNRLFWFCLWLAKPKSQASSRLRFVFKTSLSFWAPFKGTFEDRQSCSRWDSTGYDAFDDASAATETKPPTIPTPPIFFKMHDISARMTG